MYSIQYRTGWYLIPKPRYTAPFLDLEEFLDKRQWLERPLNDDERAVILDVLEYFKFIEEGIKLSKYPPEKPVLSANKASINAFIIAQKAMQLMPDHSQDLEETIQLTKNILSDIYINSRKGIKRISNQDIEITRYFLTALSLLSIDDGEST